MYRYKFANDIVIAKYNGARLTVEPPVLRVAADNRTLENRVAHPHSGA